MRMPKSQHGFTLLELMIASFIGVLVVLAISSLFKTGMDVSLASTQRAETQANMRAAIEFMSKDISQAGAGLPNGGGLQLVSGGTKSFYACDQTGVCYVVNHNYPNSGAGVANFMYGIIPGPNNGVQNGAVITNAAGLPDASITLAYCDTSFPLDNFTWTFQNANGSSVGVGLIAIPDTTKPLDIGQAGGLNQGDIILFTTIGAPVPNAPNSDASAVNKAVAAGEITNGPLVTNASGLAFVAGDPLNFNQTLNTTGSLTQLAQAANNFAGGAGKPVPSQNISACRLNVVTYFLQVPAAGGTVQTPRLMRQVNGLKPMPVADNIVNLQITYDLIDSQTGYLAANLADPIGALQSPSLIQKVNIWIMGESISSRGNKSQSMYLATSVAARDMSFCNSYSNSSTACGN